MARIPRPPVLSIGREKLRRFFRLPWAERWTLIRAALWLLAVDLGLRTVGFATVRRWLARLGRRPPGATEGSSAAEPNALERAEALARAVDIAAHHHLYAMRCLPRALTLHVLLAREGVPGTLRIGVRKGRVGKSDLDAHAWVEVDGRPVAESPEVDRHYAPLALPPA